MTVAVPTPLSRPAPSAVARKVALPAGPQLARGALLTLAALLLGLTAQILLISPLQHRAAQQRAFDELREQLALGTAPVAQTDRNGHLLAPGTPVAILTIPHLHVHQVVLEGTDPRVLTDGPGHRRDTPLPGQAGTSVLMGRAAAYGGPFGDLGSLRPGDTFTVTTGQGKASYRVLDLRRAGDPLPAPIAAGKGRLVLLTATGTPYLPSGLLRVDADLTSATDPTPPATIQTGTLPTSEEPMGALSGIPWPMVMWLQALALVSIAAVWAWHRWGRHQTWIVFAPVVAFLGLRVAGQVTELLPNLM
ncbi:sortase [Streptomyces polygonati]|uniref:Sortase n=1 Tax=Streptomyces polygonati TaxID=1617087 RepID=A0ABV8HY16_9ACTN